MKQNHSRRRRGGGRPPIWFETSKIWANSLFIWAAIAHDWQKNVSVSGMTFFFFFFWRTPQFGQKNRLIFDRERQVIFRAEVCCPPKSF